jgi:signal transduction histidine kinase
VTRQTAKDLGPAGFLAAEASEAEGHRLRRFAADLRGEIVLRAMSIRAHFGRLRRRAERSGVPFALDQVARLLDRADGLVRDVARELERQPPSEAMFPTALRWLARRTERKHGIPVTVDIATPGHSLDGPPGTLLYSATRRVFREMAFSGADGMTMRLTSDGGRRVRLSVRATGEVARALPRPQRIDAIEQALAPARRRVEAAGGTLAVRQDSPQFTEVVICVEADEAAGAADRETP